MNSWKSREAFSRILGKPEWRLWKVEWWKWGISFHNPFFSVAIVYNPWTEKFTDKLRAYFVR